MPTWLSQEEFLAFVDRSPLVSIDLVVVDSKRRMLMGFRKNPPAQEHFFVPGGRIHKGETVSEAFSRITKGEIGVECSIGSARLIGVFTHSYEDNFAGKAGVTTHYVVLAYELTALITDLGGITQQHHWWTWLNREEAEKKVCVHKYTRDYFKYIKDEKCEISDVEKKQYEVMNYRRDVYENLLWNAPVISLTAQAFLLTIALASDVSSFARVAAASLGLLTALASMHLLWKHRHYADTVARMLHATEQKNGWYEINDSFKPLGALKSFSCYRLWLFLIGVFGVVSIGVILVLIFSPELLSSRC